MNLIKPSSEAGQAKIEAVNYRTLYVRKDEGKYGR